MATKNDKAPTNPDAAGAATPKKKGKLLWIIIAAVVLLGGGGAAFFLMKSPKGAEQAAKEAAPAPHAAAVYFKFEPAFVVNFGTEGNVRYLQVTLEAMSRDPLVIEQIKESEPAIRSDLVVLFSSQKYDDLLTSEGKTRLRESTLEAIRKVITAEGGHADKVEGVYFTSFVIQ